MHAIVKTFADVHHRVDFAPGVFSDRVILPMPDNCRVKVTRFQAKAGFKSDENVNACDETVYVVSGVYDLSFGDRTVQIGPGMIYLIPAGVKFRLEVKQDIVVICVFSQAGSMGPLVDNR